jgi:hypothetical protein
MSRYDIIRDDEKLMLSTPVERRMIAAGCPLFLFASASLLVLGTLSVIYQSRRQPGRQASDLSALFDPHVNQFGFLWLMAVVFIAAMVPIYAYFVRRWSTAYCFDMSKGALLRFGKPVTWLSRIEFIRVTRTRDADEHADFAVVIVHDDGHELKIDESDDEGEMRWLAREVAEFTGVRIVGNRVKVA